MSRPSRCPKCHTETAYGDLFCRRCGTSLKHFQPATADTLISVARAVAHRMNNALSIVLTGSQLAMHQIVGLPREARSELEGYLRDIATAAADSGAMIHQFQKFLDSFADEHLRGEIETFADQIVGDLRTPVSSERYVFQETLTRPEDARVGHISVLIVDDEEKIRHSLSYALTLAGYHVITASNGQEALTLLKDNSYDVAFVDLKMPDMDGWEVTSAVKRMSPDTVVVLMTGWSVRLDNDKLRENRVDAVLTKPFELSKITDLISATVR